MRPKRIAVNGQVYLRKLTAGQARDNERKWKAAYDAYVAADTGSDEEKAAYDRLWECTLGIVRECVTGAEGDDGAVVEFDADAPIEDQIDHSDLQELALHCCGQMREGVTVIGQAPLAT
jgi:hypothetical protein